MGDYLDINIQGSIQEISSSVIFCQSLQQFGAEGKETHLARNIFNAETNSHRVGTEERSGSDGNYPYLYRRYVDSYLNDYKEEYKKILAKNKVPSLSEEGTVVTSSVTEEHERVSHGVILDVNRVLENTSSVVEEQERVSHGVILDVNRVLENINELNDAPIIESETIAEVNDFNKPVRISKGLVLDTTVDEIVQKVQRGIILDTLSTASETFKSEGEVEEFIDEDLFNFSEDDEDSVEEETVGSGISEQVVEEEDRFNFSEDDEDLFNFEDEENTSSSSEVEEDVSEPVRRRPRREAINFDDEINDANNDRYSRRGTEYSDGRYSSSRDRFNHRRDFDKRNDHSDRELRDYEGSGRDFQGRSIRRESEDKGLARDTNSRSRIERVSSDNKVVYQKKVVAQRSNEGKTLGDSQQNVSYRSVRDFVKQNKGCSLSDIQKYFSVKEIKKALLSAKIVERKGKYYTV